MLFSVKNVFIWVFTALCLCGCQYLPDTGGGQNAPPSAPPDFLKPISQTPEANPVIENYIEPPPQDFQLYFEPVEAKGIYVTANIAGLPDLFGKRLDLVNGTELNSMVIDVKNDVGNITFRGKIPLADELGITTRLIGDIDGLMAQLKENNVYTIARVVVFKDDVIANTYPDFAIKVTDGSNGGIYREKVVRASGKVEYRTMWLNPYNRDVWEYIAELSEQIAVLGFDEIQYDYIRFPTDANIKNADFGDTGGLSKTDIITEFSEYICTRLKPYNIRLSADIFGTIITSATDAELIGQDAVRLAGAFDIICPMVYPSHFASGSLGIDFPDLNPYDTIYKSMSALQTRLNEIPEGEQAAIVRPWLQDFSYSGAGYQKYGPEQIRQQIQGVYDAGLREWLLWNSSNIYTEGGLLSNEQE